MQTPEPDVAVYVGPTAAVIRGMLINNPRLMVLPPIARGDLAYLPDCIRTILVVDGYFGVNSPSVGHLELIRTMERCKVYGCASMGAIRAFELRNDGMIGLGRVYNAFFEMEDFMDDEVALLHAPAPYYWPLSVPLVSVRFALKELQANGLCDLQAREVLVETLKGKYFGDRTVGAVATAARDVVGDTLAKALINKLGTCDVKRADFDYALAIVLRVDKDMSGGSL